MPSMRSMEQTTASQHRPPRKRNPQVNIVLTAEEVAMFAAQAATWSEPGVSQPRTESLGRTIKRLAMEQARRG